MPASKQLQKYWRSASDAELALLLREATCSVTAFAQATAASGSLLQTWIGGQEVVEFDHFPANDVVDLRRGCQFYYHSHRQAGLEHGHLHLFWHASASGRRRYLRPGRARWQRSAPTHLFAVSLDSRGLPIALFTVNRWVTEGPWFDAQATLKMVERFAMGDVEGHEHSCRWLTGFVRLYRPLIEELLSRRDQRLARAPDPKQALNDRRLEVLSTRPIDWMADLEALQEQASLRGLSHPA
jgi:hypothetical protein